MGKNIIEKAKVGDTKMYQGKQYYVHALNAKGQPLWRQVGSKKDGGSDSQAPAAKQQPAAQAAAQPAHASTQVSAPAKQETAPKKEEAKYDAPKPTVQYQTVKPADGVEIRVPEVWKTDDPKNPGKKVDQHRSAYRKLYADKTKKTDDDVIKMVNRPRGTKEIRQIAYEEAMARGIPESKLNAIGTLQDWWDSEKLKKELFSRSKKGPVDEEEQESYDNSILGDFDVEGFLDENFDGGRDDGWKDPDNKIIRREFNDLKNASARRKYDAFVDYAKRLDPMYESPEEVMNTLARAIASFVTSKGGSPIMVSAGGAGAGKTFKFNQVADLYGMTRYDSSMQPGSGSYNYYIASADVDDDKDFMRLLDDHNGKLIVFDDKDKLLMSDANKIISTMKAIADGDPKMRVFEGKDGTEKLFTGKILFLTNKDKQSLNKNEDHKAIMSRARFEDVHFTVNENLELLKKRYKSMGDHLEHATPQEEAKIRETLFRIIMDYKDRLDPKTFTVRKFTKMLEKVDETLMTNKDIDETAAAEEAFGSNKKDWRKVALQELMKAQQSEELLKGTAREDFEALEPEQLATYRERFSKNRKKAEEIFGKEFVLAVLNSSDDETEEKVEETDEEVKKSFLDEIGGMTLGEAESILFD